MYTGINELYQYRVTYCSLKILYDESKWWQFTRKRAIKELMDWYYPLMRKEVKREKYY